MNNFSKRLAGLSLGLLLTLAVGVAGGQHSAVGVKAEDATTSSTLIIDGSELTGTATTADSTNFYSNTAIVMSSGAKQQKVGSGATNNISENAAILIGKQDAYIYNKTPIGSKITKFEIYANKGASTKVSIGVNFSDSPISAYDSTSDNTYIATLSTLDSVYDASTKLSANSKYFWYQVTNANNSQVQFRITYESDTSVPSVNFELPESLKIGATGTLTATANPSNSVVKWEALEKEYLTLKDDGSYTALKGGVINVVAWIYANDDTEFKNPLACCKKTSEIQYNYEGEGTIENPYTVSDAYYIASKLDKGKNNGKVVYVKGKISGDITLVKKDEAVVGASFDISDNSSTLLAYSIAGATNVFKGATVVVSGAVINYSGKYEIGYATDFETSLVSCVGDAASYVAHFASSLETVCADPAKDNLEALTPVWTNLKASWAYVDEASKGTLKAATEDDPTYGAFAEKYDHIMTRYGEEKLGEGANFVGRALAASVSGAPSVLSASNNSLTITIIVLVSVLSVSLIIGTTLIIRKRKVN